MGVKKWITIFLWSAVVTAIAPARAKSSCVRWQSPTKFLRFAKSIGRKFLVGDKHTPHLDPCFGGGLFAFMGCVRVIRVGVSKVQLFEELGMSSALQGFRVVSSDRLDARKSSIAPMLGFIGRC